MPGAPDHIRQVAKSKLQRVFQDAFHTWRMSAGNTGCGMMNAMEIGGFLVPWVRKGIHESTETSFHDKVLMLVVFAKQLQRINADCKQLIW